ncbi:MAG: aminoacyl-tRNA hydrolase [Erysipelotrichaceae bacterium]|nr:aminoacyl-tRNA hydrolase [Erysipelotrichaceae bacterium]
MKLIVGLGNPGKEYINTRHNVGFMVMDALSQEFSVDINIKKFKGEYIKFKYKGEDIIFLKPLTYMNNSGESIIQCMHFFKIDIDDLLVIYDDLDMPTGKLRLRETGGSGGHNGIKSIIAQTGTQNFKRIRIGIEKDKRINTIDYVLGKFTPLQQPLINEGVNKAVEAVKTYLDKGFNAAMNSYN